MRNVFTRKVGSALAIMLLSSLPSFSQDPLLKQSEMLQSLDNQITLEKEAGIKPKLDARFLWFWGSRTTPNDAPVDPGILWDRYYEYKSANNSTKSGARGGGWEYALPKQTPSGRSGDGRVNLVRVHPTNPNIWFATTPGAGLWKTEDNGKTWVNVTADLPLIAVTDIAISPSNPNIMYLATGDGYGYAIGNGTFWGGTYSNGVLKSTDGGNTWAPSGLTFTVYNIRLIHRLIVHPTDPNLVLAATSFGIHKSKDGGSTWSRLTLNRATDLMFHPNDPSIVYASSNTFMKSVDTGSTWVYKSISLTAFPTNASLIGMSPSNDSTVYYCSVTSNRDIGLYKSTNYGETFTFVSSPTQHGSQGYFSTVFSVSPTDVNTLYVGGVNLRRSTNGGTNWTTITSTNVGSTYVHPDMRQIVYLGTTGDTMLVSHDGGISRTNNGGNTWTSASNGIIALQLYRIGSAVQDPSFFLVGAQDNGVNLFRDNPFRWDHVRYGDGMESVVDPTDRNTIYTSTQNGVWYKSTNGGTNFSNMAMPSTGNWISPFKIHPFDNQTVFYGGIRLHKSEQSGINWQTISPTIFVQYVDHFDISSLDPNFMVMAIGRQTLAPTTRLYITNDGGTNWTNINKGLPSNIYLSSVTLSKVSPGTIVVTFAGYDDSNKVFISRDSGKTYTNISAGLPRLPVHCFAFERTVEEGMFVGTEMGVFYRNNTMDAWEDFNDGLPVTIINEIEVFPDYNKVRIATFGRGVWDAPMVSTQLAVPTMHDPTRTLNITAYPNPASDILSLRTNYEVANATIQLIDLNGKVMYSQSQVRLNPSSNWTISLSTLQLKAGVYLLQVNNGQYHSVQKVLIQ